MRHGLRHQPGRQAGGGPLGDRVQPLPLANQRLDLPVDPGAEGVEVSSQVRVALMCATGVVSAGGLEHCPDVVQRHARVREERDASDPRKVGDVVFAVPAGGALGLGEHAHPVVVPDAARADPDDPGDLSDSHTPILNLDTVTRSISGLGSAPGAASARGEGDRHHRENGDLRDGRRFRSQKVKSGATEPSSGM